MKVTRGLSVVLLFVFAVSVIGCAGSRTQKSTGEYVDDSVITTKVKSLILADQGLSGFAIEVQTFKGVVQLSGFVDTQEQVVSAGNIASDVSGVQSVENNILVKGSQ